MLHHGLKVPHSLMPCKGKIVFFPSFKENFSQCVFYDVNNIKGKVSLAYEKH